MSAALATPVVQIRFKKIPQPTVTRCLLGDEIAFKKVRMRADKMNLMTK
jgi:hypothetical protein